jgi:hypothetical protein
MLHTKVLDRIQPGQEIKIIEGPSCSEGFSFWRVEATDGLAGWVMEGDPEIQEYFVCPLP